MQNTTDRTIVHRATVYIPGIEGRGGWKPQPISGQFRYVIRLAYACSELGLPYSLSWYSPVECSEVVRAVPDANGTFREEKTAIVESKGRLAACITVTASRIPMPKSLPKAPKPKPVAVWKPAIWDAVYRLDAYHDANRKKRCPGFVIEHSCGLSLVHPSESGELGVTQYGGDEDIRQNWLITHTASGMGFGLTLTFKRATDALQMAASFAVDWTQPVDVLRSNPEFRRAGNSVVATYGKSHERDTAKRKLAELERAA